MDKINFENLPSTNTPLDADTLNEMQSNIEKSVVAVGKTQPSTGENVWIKKGKNLINTNSNAWENGTMDGSTGIESNRDNRIIMRNYASVVGSKQYTVSVKNTSYQIVNGVFFNENYGYVTSVSAIASQINFTSLTFTAPSTAKYVKFYVRTSTDGNLTPSDITSAQIQLEQNASATSYEAYIPKRIYTKNGNGTFEEFYNENKEEEKYSTQETKIGTWINGKPLYRTVMTSTSYNSSSYSIPISNVKDIINVTGIVRRSDYSNLIEVIPSRLDNAGMSVQFGNITIASNTTVTVGIAWGTNWSQAFGSIILIIEYTKTTD